MRHALGWRLLAKNDERPPFLQDTSRDLLGRHAWRVGRLCRIERYDGDARRRRSRQPRGRGGGRRRERRPGLQRCRELADRESAMLPCQRHRRVWCQPVLRGVRRAQAADLLSRALTPRHDGVLRGPAVHERRVQRRSTLCCKGSRCADCRGAEGDRCGFPLPTCGPTLTCCPFPGSGSYCYPSCNRGLDQEAEDLNRNPALAHLLLVIAEEVIE